MQYQGREITTVEGLADGDGDCTRCRRPSSSMTASSAATARRARSARRSAWPPRWRAACRAHVTADLAADTIALSRDELRERMSGNLCRCGAYNGIVDAIARDLRIGREAGRRMIPFSYSRADDAAAAIRSAAAGRRASISAAAPIWST